MMKTIDMPYLGSELFKPSVAADEQRSAAENLFDDAEYLLHPLVRPPAGGQADARSAVTFTRPQGG